MRPVHITIHTFLDVYGMGLCDYLHEHANFDMSCLGLAVGAGVGVAVVSQRG